MTFTASGLGVIPKDQAIKENQYENTIYFHFNLISKDPYKDKHIWTKVNLSVPCEYIEEARDKIKPGKALQIRIGELKGNLLDSGYVAMTIFTKWKWVEPIKAMPNPKRKKYEDV